MKLTPIRYTVLEELPRMNKELVSAAATELKIPLDPHHDGTWDFSKLETDELMQIYKGALNWASHHA